MIVAYVDNLGYTHCVKCVAKLELRVDPKNAIYSDQREHVQCDDCGKITNTEYGDTH